MSVTLRPENPLSRGEYANYRADDGRTLIVRVDDLIFTEGNKLIGYMVFCRGRWLAVEPGKIKRRDDEQAKSK